MLRVLRVTTIICIYCHMLLPQVEAATLSVNRQASTETNSEDTTDLTTTTSITNVTPSTTSHSSDDEVSALKNKQEERYEYYHPAEAKKPHVIEEFSHHYLDGSYEYKYILSNGVTRYEKSYWKLVARNKILLARKGFYSHPLPNHKYLTVFYTADENGFQQDTAKYTNAVPTLPKHLDVPQLEFPHEANAVVATTTTRKPTTTTRKITTRKPKATTTQRPVVKPSNFNWIY